MPDDQTVCECWCHERGCDQAVPPADPVAVMKAAQATWLELPAAWPDGRDVARSLAGMLESRYSGQPTQRDLDVAEVAYAAGAAAERERIREFLRSRAELWTGDPYAIIAAELGEIADLLDGRP